MGHGSVDEVAGGGPPVGGAPTTLARLLAAAGAAFTADPTTLTLVTLDVEAARAARLLPASSGPDDWRAPGFAAGLVDAADRGRVEAALRAAGEAPRTVEWRSAYDRRVREVLAREGGLVVGAWIDLGPAPPRDGPPDLRCLDELPDPVFVKDEQHRWILVNRAFCELMGHPREALLGRSDRDFFPPEQADVFWAKDALVLAEGGVNVNEEWLTDREGRTLRISTKKSAFVDPSTGRKILVGVIRDITDRVAAEVALRESEARFRAIFDQGPLGMALLDGGLRLGQVNPALCRMLGREPGELLGRSLAELTHHEDRGREGDTAEHLLRGDVAVQKSERRYLRPDGTVVWAALTVSLIGEHDGQNPCFVAMLEDADERKGAEAAVLEARDAALESARAKSRFLAVMSHEIRTPMNAVVGMTGVLLDTRLSPEQRECVETIRHSGDALLELIDDILDFSKLESDRLELERLSFGLRSCVESAMDLVASRAAEKGLTLSLVVDDPAPVQVVGDPSRIRQILLNLLSNAVKFTLEGEVRVIVNARPLAAPRWELTFAVADSGVGIPSDRLGRLFQAFSQVDATTTRRYGGTGLGLAISKRLVELMEGTIGVESLPGSGSTFRFTLPLDAVPDARDELVAGRAALSGRRLLVVEEGLGARLMAGRLAEAWGMSAKLTGDPREALAWIDAGEAFHAGLVGERAPSSTGLDAYALARALRERRDARALPLVLAIDVGQSGMQRLGGLFQGQVTRPVKASQLQTVLLGVLGERPATAEHEGPPAIDHALGSRHPLRILLVDDNAVNLRVATRVLERMGYRADTATTGSEALDAVRRRRFDVVLMDVQMPVMDGVEATRRIRAELPLDLQPRIVAMTADVLPGDRERCLASGMDDFVGKPVRVEEVQAALLRAPPGVVTPDPDALASRAARAVPRRATTRGAHAPAHAPAEALPDALPIDPQVVDLTASPRAPGSGSTPAPGSALDEECLRSLRAAAGETAIHDLLELFLTDVPPMLESIRASVGSGDAPEVLRVAHGLRGSCGALGARLMIAPCAALEEAARGKDLGDAGRHLNALLEAFERTRADAARRIKQEDRRKGS